MSFILLVCEMEITKLPWERCEFLVVKCLGGWKGNISFPTLSSMLASLRHWPQWTVMDPQVSCPREMCNLHFWLSLGAMNSCQPQGLMSLSSILCVGDGRICSARQMRNSRLGSSADLVIPFLPGCGCSPTGDTVLSKAVALLPPVAFHEIRIYTTAWGCVHSWSLGHSITTNIVTTSLLKNILILTVFLVFF